MNNLSIVIDGRITHNNNSMSGISLISGQYDPTPANFAEEYRKAKQAHIQYLSDQLSEKSGLKVQAEYVEINYMTVVRFWDDPI